jgi:hypothetical protein
MDLNTTICWEVYLFDSETMVPGESHLPLQLKR